MSLHALMMWCCLRRSPLLPQWDVLAHGNQVQEVSRIPVGTNPGNCISLLRVSEQPVNACLYYLFFITWVRTDGVVVAAGPELEPEQQADPAGELHGRVGVAGGVLADRPPGGERGDERGGPIGHPAAPLGLRHPSRRPPGDRVGWRVQQRRAAGGLCRHRRVPDRRQQPAVVQAQRRVRLHHQQPRHHHRAADQGGAQLRRPLTFIYLPPYVHPPSPPGQASRPPPQ
jgi:hypothetical protein